MKRVTVLGATGSIGRSTLDVMARHSDRYELYAATAHSNLDELLSICIKHRPKFAILATDAGAADFKQRLRDSGLSTEVRVGVEAMCEASSAKDVDVVVAAIVGAAGLTPTLAAVNSGKRILLANKEALVMTGGLFMDAVRKHGAELLPIDSEHNAIYQCLPEAAQRLNDSASLAAHGVTRVLLTASGGPFRHFSREQLQQVTPEQACKHPNWSMGRKISVDSASLMNKGLELIEACWLFDLAPGSVQVHLHPESIIHSMVEYVDGSILAQMGNPDMRTPIAYGLAWPERVDAGVEPLDLFSIGKLHFEKPDKARFPCLRLAEEAFALGGTAPAVVNAANEVAVDAFLQGGIRFVDIPVVIEKSLLKGSIVRADSVETVIEADRVARQYASKAINELAGGVVIP
ncbi:1-deoxy-D-xylulose-5-phosphate reductoisomerase [Hahella sp. NBU794]|uniref:1-deoxy-D-xylulose-5-phosphate reductoisomerase n=1 Tax=Hahella sp. NBU794 TaxID=3422590 RepID=UPI003D6FAEF0